MIYYDDGLDNVPFYGNLDEEKYFKHFQIIATARTSSFRAFLKRRFMLFEKMIYLTKT